MYEFHGIRWMNDSELDPDSPEHRGAGWAHAYVPVVGPDGEATGTAHVPIYMPRIYKELKRFALRVYKMAGGTTGNVEMSGWWNDVKKGFKKIIKVVAKNKVLRAVAEKGLQAAVPGGAAVSEKAAGILGDLVSKYRGGSSEAASQIKGLLENAKKGNEQDAKVLDEVRREYTRQQAAGLPALLSTMASGDVVVYDPIYGAKRKMSKKKQKKVNTQRMKAAMDAKRKAAQATRKPGTSPLRNSPRGPMQPGMRAQQLRQGMLAPGLQAQQLQPGYQYPQQGYPQDYGYPQQGYPQGQSYDDGGGQGGPQYDPEQEAQDDADLQQAAEENMARMSSQEDFEDEGAAMEGDAYFDIGAKLKLSADEQRVYAKLPPQERENIKKMKKPDAHKYLASRGEAMQRGKESKQRGQAQKAQDTIKAMRQGQIVREQKSKLMKEAQRRIQAEKNNLHAQKDGYEAKLRDLDNELHDRDMDDDKRDALQAQKAAYQARLQVADKDLVKFDLESQRLEMAHREAMAKIRQAAPQAPAPVIYDDERGEEYDTDDPLVREALAVMQQAEDVAAEDNDEE